MDGMDLTYADFSHADLSGVDLTGASMFRAQLHAVQDQQAHIPDRPRALGTDPDQRRAETWNPPR